MRALIDLGIAQELGRPMLKISELANHERIPIKFLEAILVQLKDAGYLGSKRGKLGGVFLRLPMKKISMGNVIRLIDGPLPPLSCASGTRFEPCFCPDIEHCGLRMLMVDVRNATANILDRYSLADTVEVTLRKIRRDKVALPFIRNLASILKPHRSFVTALGPPNGDTVSKPLRKQASRKPEN